MPNGGEMEGSRGPKGAGRWAAEAFQEDLRTCLALQEGLRTKIAAVERK